MFTTEVRDEELSVVRGQLDNLAQRRSITGLTSSEQVRYGALCASERMLLSK